MKTQFFALTLFFYFQCIAAAAAADDDVKTYQSSKDELTSYRNHSPKRSVMAIGAQFSQVDDLINNPKNAWKFLNYIASLHIVGEHKECVNLLLKFIDENTSLFESDARLNDITHAMLAHSYALSGLKNHAHKALDEVVFKKPTLGDVLSMAMIYADLDQNDIVLNLINRISYEDMFNNVEDYKNFNVQTYIALLLVTDQIDLAVKLLNKLDKTVGTDNSYYGKYLRFRLSLESSSNIDHVKKLYEALEDDVIILPIIRAEDN